MLNGVGGYDWKGFVSQIIAQQKKVQLDPVERQISQYKSLTSEIGKFSGKINEIISVAEGLRAVSGPFYPLKATSSNQNIATASTSSSSAQGVYSLIVNQLAQAGSVTTNTSFSSKSAAIASSLDDSLPEAQRTITATIGTGSNQITASVVVTSSTTLEQLANALNTQFNGQASALIINTGTQSNPQYKLQIVATNTGTDKGTVQLSYTGPDTTLQNFVSDVTTQNAQNASFTLNSVTYQSDKNTNIEAGGLVLSLSGVGSATITVAPDYNSAKDKIKRLVDKINGFLESYKSANSVDPQNPQKFGTLRLISADDRAEETLKDILKGTITEGGNTYSLASVGITFDWQTGKFKLNEAQLDQMIQQNPEAVKKLFQKIADDLASPTSSFKQYTKPGGILEQVKQTFTTETQKLEEIAARLKESLIQQEQELITKLSRVNKLMQGFQYSLSILQRLQVGL